MEINLRKIEMKDLELLRTWRMKESVTKYLFTDPIISKDEQINWYNRILLDNRRLDYVIIVNKAVIGYYGITNIDYINKSCEVGFYIGDETYRGIGLFTEIEKCAESVIFNDLELEKIYIEVFEDNPILKKYFQLGFIEYTERKTMYKNGYQHIVLRLIKYKNN